MYVYGKNVAKEMQNKIEKVYVTHSFKDKSLLNKIKAPIIYVDKNKLDKIAGGVHQGIVLKIADYKYKNIDDLADDKVVILDHLEDPHNLGAIIRTCEAAGIKDIIIPKDRSVQINSTVMKTSAGCLDRVNLYQVTNLVQTIQYLKKQGFWIIGTDMNGTDYKKIDYNGKIAIIIGNEGKGISKLVKESCDFVASIPMYGTVNSLNASVAAGIVLFEIRRNHEL